MGNRSSAEPRITPIAAHPTSSANTAHRFGRAHLYSCVSCARQATFKLTDRIHPKVPIRLLLSVSSTALFLSSWTHVEPCLIDLTVIQAGRGSKRGASVNAILKVNCSLAALTVGGNKLKCTDVYRTRSGRGNATGRGNDWGWSGFCPESSQGG